MVFSRCESIVIVSMAFALHRHGANKSLLWTTYGARFHRRSSRIK